MAADPSVWLVELERGVWVAPWDGDPGRTLRAENAQRFVLHSDAEKALAKARRFHPFKRARIQTLEALDGQ